MSIDTSSSLHPTLFSSNARKVLVAAGTRLSILHHTRLSFVRFRRRQRQVWCKNLSLLQAISSRSLAASVEEEFYLLGVINSRLTRFFWKTMFADFKTVLPQVTVFSLEQIPIKQTEKMSKHDLAVKNKMILAVKAMLDAQRGFQNFPLLLEKKVLHSTAPPAISPITCKKISRRRRRRQVPIDDVQQTGFVHEISVVPDGNKLHTHRFRRPKGGRRAACLAGAADGVQGRRAASNSSTPAGGSSWGNIPSEEMDQGQETGAGLSIAGQPARTAGLFSARRPPTISAAL